MPELDIETYQRATWEFLMEHCDIEKSGAIFVKFHMSGRNDFERRIRSRANGYHREDIEIKEKNRKEKENTHTAEKNKKKEEYKRSQRRRKRFKWITDLLLTFKKK